MILEQSWTQIFSGETVRLRCWIQGGEGTLWTYEWQKDKLDTSVRSSQYRINKADESDSGEYSCRGRKNNFTVTEWSVYTLTVSGRLNIFISLKWLLFLFVQRKY